MHYPRQRQGAFIVLAAAVTIAAAAAFLRPVSTGEPVGAPSQRLLLQSAQFSGPSVGWVLLRNPSGGAIRLVKTDDRGRHWRTLRVPVTATSGVLSLQVIDASSAVLQGRGRIVVTGDGGETWRVLSLPHTYPVPLALDFVDPSHAWYLAGDRGPGVERPVALWSTRDGGTTWNLLWSLGSTAGGASGVPLDGSKTLVGFDTPREGWMDVIGVTSTQLFVTRDAGATWIRSDVAVNGQAVSIKLFAPQTVIGTFSLSAGYEVMRSIDGGRKWAAVPDGETASVPTVMAPGAWVETAGNRLRLTDDGGTTWRSVVARMPRGLVLDDVLWFWESSGGYAIARDGLENPYLLATADGGRNWYDVTAPQVRFAD